MLRTSSRALLIFTRNPVPGKCKTRLAATIGDQAALEVYLILLRHTAAITAKLNDADKLVYFSEHLGNGTIWDPETFRYKLQEGTDLGQRMQNAFEDAFEAGYSEVLIIGSDMYNLNTSDLKEAFNRFMEAEVVLGPAQDGGYYLLGLKGPIPKLFRNKAWGTHTVLKDTLEDLKDLKVSQLSVRNDIDQYEDIAGIPVFETFAKKIK
ncbi:TIGR04282 family arsenosugar biosynthesis glycosyltransferase [Robiginitalea aurantiaca]|uniref:TIGR04282 family arsenosugar biosynthesis glycosyltransferase n=1 Tax=Robiginitalea aurantiaca TaxID=3056915 RepID=A0ABT7WEW3_9FLAO|nr:TIGR04282 family arsenosugar biosynthesis glycosyltransferase [Robiginitalea aurantiaca]MDM9631451.1 TIGR04282 family arsenosugar biosynthesis glycosyltransferase [Robiginitalea aurantiaca]